MDKIEDGGPAFPTSIEWGPEGGTGFQDDPAGEPGTTTYYCGMTLRQYAAIKLRVPNSGTDWLDEMIRTSLRDDLAAKAMQGMAGSHGYCERGWDQKDLAGQAYELADATLAARREEK